MVVRKLIQAKIFDGDILDSGANLGDNTLPMAMLLRDAGSTARIHAVEPYTRFVHFILELAAENGLDNVRVYNHFLSSAAGAPMPQIPGTNQSSRTIDDLRTSLRNRFGLLHLDLEGGESKVLKGAIDTLREDAPVIITEKHWGDASINSFMKVYGYIGHVLPEICGKRPTCRNTLWLTAEHGARLMRASDGSQNRSSPAEVLHDQLHGKTTRWCGDAGSSAPKVARNCIRL
jgi:FkbM family methyltransferase